MAVQETAESMDGLSGEVDRLSNEERHKLIEYLIGSSPAVVRLGLAHLRTNGAAALTLPAEWTGGNG